MGFADSVTGRLFCSRRRSDLEFEIQSIMERKLAILDDCNKIAGQLSNSVFSTGAHGTITHAAIVPGWSNPSATDPAIDLSGSEVAYGAYVAGVDANGDPIDVEGYEALLADLQTKEKELEVKQNKFEVELEAVKAEEESLKKIADDHAKKDFKIG